MGPASVSANSYNIKSDNYSETSSIINVPQNNRNLNRVLPPANIHKDPEFLPIGIGGISDQSNLKYQQMIAKLNQLDKESTFRVKSMFLNRPAERSVISHDEYQERGPRYTFGHNEGKASLPQNLWSHHSINNVQSNFQTEKRGLGYSTMEMNHNQNQSGSIKFSNRLLKMSANEVKKSMRDDRSISSRESSEERYEKYAKLMKYIFIVLNQ